MIEDGNISGAHDLLRQMYRMNNWKSIYTYPVHNDTTTMNLNKFSLSKEKIIVTFFFFFLTD